MNIDYLTLFVRVAHTKNISQAGRELYLSPAVASTYLNKLEAQVGARLIHRTTRKVTLTEDGKTFLPHAEAVLNTIETAKSAVGSAAEAPQGTLRVTAPASFGRMHIVPVLQAFLASHPGLTVEIKLSDTIVDMIEGGYDVAIRDAALSASSLHARKLAPDRRILVASPDYLAKMGTPQSLASLDSHQAITLIGLENWRFRLEGKNHSITPRCRLKMDNGEAVRDAAIAGGGITVMSTWCCYNELIDGRLVQVLEDIPLVPECAIWALYPTHKLLSPKVRVFIDYLTANFGESPYWDNALISSS